MHGACALLGRGWRGGQDCGKGAGLPGADLAHSRASLSSPLLQTWLVEQQRLVYADSQQALTSGLPRCLPPLTPSLDQAGGLQRLALRGHTAPVTKVLLTPSGTDAVTASADGTARVWDLDIGDSVLLLEGHAGPITDMAVTSGGWVVRGIGGGMLWVDLSPVGWGSGEGRLGGFVSSHRALLLHACAPQHTFSASTTCSLMSPLSLAAALLPCCPALQTAAWC